MHFKRAKVSPQAVGSEAMAMNVVGPSTVLLHRDALAIYVLTLTKETLSKVREVAPHSKRVHRIGGSEL